MNLNIFNKNMELAEWNDLLKLVYIGHFFGLKMKAIG